MMRRHSQASRGDRRETSAGPQPATPQRGLNPRARAAGFRPAAARPQAAFTLLEVMIALSIFFVAVFAILSLVTTNLNIARGLTLGEVEVGSVAAEIAQTNALEEGSISGDFGDAYPGAYWNADVSLWLTNQGAIATQRGGPGLYKVDITVDWPQNGAQRQKQVTIFRYVTGSPRATPAPIPRR